MALSAFSLANLRQQLDDIVVFMCAKCRLPFGDSTDLSSGHSEGDVILLQAVSENIYFENQPVVSSFSHETGCVFQILKCVGCKSTVGRIYVAAPRGQDAKLDVFTLNAAALTKYAFGSAVKQVIKPSDEPLTLERYQVYEDEIKKCKQILGILQRKVEALESQVSS